MGEATPVIAARSFGFAPFISKLTRRRRRRFGVGPGVGRAFDVIGPGVGVGGLTEDRHVLEDGCPGRYRPSSAKIQALITVFVVLNRWLVAAD